MTFPTGPTPFWSLRSRIVASPPSSTSWSSPFKNRCESPTSRAMSSGTPTPDFAETGTIPRLWAKSLTRS